MNILKAYGGMSTLLRQAANAIGESQFTPDLFSNLRFCDVLLQQMSQDPAVPEAVRVEVYTTLLSTGPGGLLAFVWLLKTGHISAKLLDNYVACLQVGPDSASRGKALDHKATQEAAEVLLGYKPLNEEQQLHFSTRLLNCSAIQNSARVTLLKKLLSADPAHSPGLSLEAPCRYALALWATGCPGPADEPARGLAAGEELFRVGLVARAQMGEDVAELLAAHSGDEPADIGPTQAEGLLDLLEHFSHQVPKEQRQNLLFHLRRHDDPKIRRRAYQLAEATEGEAFLRLGLRDLDAGVRSWVLARVSQSRSKPARSA